MTTGPDTATPTHDEFPSGRWRGRWIWGSPAPTSLTPTAEPKLDRAKARGYVLLRRSFALDRVPERAIARCTADSRYVLYVNGRELGRGPVRSHPQRLHYDPYDLAPALVPGDNVIAVLARHYGLATPWWMPSTPTFGLGGGSFLFEGALGDASSDGTEWIATDDSWRALQPPAWDELAGAGIGDMSPEACDGRELPAGWLDVDFDDSSWKPATMLATNYVGYGGDPHPPTHPYGPLLPRPVPKLTGATKVGHAISMATFVAPPAATLVDDPVAQYGADEKAGDDRTALVIDADGAVTVDPTGGTVHVIVIDFGEQVAGHVGIEIDAPAGTRIDTKAAEAIADGRLEALQQHSGFRYIARGHDDRFETFDKIGLRFLGLSIRGDTPGPITVKQVTVRERNFPRLTVTTAPAPADGARAEVPYFECSDPLLNDIWRIGRRTVDLCSQDAYLDCPSREQRGWTGDSVVHQMVDFTTNLDWSLAKWNVELGGSPRPDGMLPMAAGGDFEYHDNTMIPDWALHWIHAVHNIYRYTGDIERVGSLLPIAERVLRWFEQFQSADGLLDNVTGWVIIDWSAVSGEGKSAALNGLYARALNEFAEMSRWIGDLGRDQWAGERWMRVNDGYDKFWDEGRGLFVDNIIGGQPGRATSQHGIAAALVGGLVQDERRGDLAALMVDTDRIEHAAWLVPGRQATLDGKGDMYAGFGYLVTGPPPPWWDVESGIVAAQPFYRYVVHDAVVAAGRPDLIPALCRDWSVLMERSATTWTECWYGGSYCHGWCSTPTRDLVQHTLGVTPSGPGFDRANIEPVLGDLDWVKGAVPTPSGLVYVSFTADQLEIDTPIPAEVVIHQGAGTATRHLIDAGHHVLAPVESPRWTFGSSEASAD